MWQRSGKCSDIVLGFIYTKNGTPERMSSTTGETYNTIPLVIIVYRTSSTVLTIS